MEKGILRNEHGRYHLVLQSNNGLQRKTFFTIRSHLWAVFLGYLEPKQGILI